MRHPTWSTHLLALSTLVLLAGACASTETSFPPTTTAASSIRTPDTSAPAETAAPTGEEPPPTTAPETATTDTAPPPPTTQTLVPWTGAHHPLTGLPAVNGLSRLPALAVKIGNNDIRSLPQVGLEQADIVYETHIENDVTRFLGIYQSQLPDRIGLVRSARSTDINLIGNLKTPYFAYWGSNEGVGDEISAAEDVNIFVARSTNGVGQENFVRDDSRGASPFNGFLNAQGLMAAATGSAPDPVFQYGDLPASAVPAAGVRWSTPNRQIDYVWDTASERWLRFQGGVPQLDQNGAQLAADNVLFLYVDYRTSAADFASPQAVSIGSGDGWLLREGTVTGVVWGRPFASNGWHLADDDTDEVVELTPGITWVALARLGEGEVLDLTEAAALTG
ncbi:MAG: hypothetical protein CL435_00685 [Acidimicrobiaceae bacterium]|nr:hypothetical protein [Acidimicrobiaceae bacterium]HJO79848.1 DUF3048 domain-containing protein [Acidimicrobiales bacterium]